MTISASKLAIKGEVVAINLSEKKGMIKTPVPFGVFQADFGLVGDAHAGPGHRQISLLAQESVDKMRNQSNLDLSAGKFAENLTTKNIALASLPIGTLLQIGTSLHEVTQIGKECHNNCAIKQQVGDCVMPREGIFTRVLQGGEVQPGDAITVVNKS